MFIRRVITSFINSTYYDTDNVTFIDRMTTSFMLSAVTYNLDKLFGDIYINTAILGVVSITAKIMTAFAIHNFGRKLSLMVILVCAILMGILGAVGQTLEGMPF